MRVRRQGILCLALLLSIAGHAGAQEWTRFRGPNGSGVSRAATVPIRWTESDYNWRVALPGHGHSSPVLWGDRVFLTSGDEESGAHVVLCLHAADGRLLWERPFEGEVHQKHNLNSFASSTPAVDQDRVYVTRATPEAHLVQALDHDGTPLWQADLGPFLASHGGGVSPIVHGGLVVVPHEHGGASALAALDAGTGKVRWRVERESSLAYSTPCFYERPGRPAEVIFTNWEHGITALDLRDGRTSWEIAAFDPGHVETPIGSPIVAGDLVLGTSGWLSVVYHTVAVRPDDAEPGAAREVYRLERGAPLTTTPVVKDDLLFLWADNGIVTCADVTTGNVHWRNRVGGTYYGSPVVVGDAVYCVSAAGEAVVLAASREFEEFGRFPLGEGSHSTPAVAGGVMYLRTFSHLISLGGK